MKFNGRLVVLFTFVVDFFNIASVCIMHSGKVDIWGLIRPFAPGIPFVIGLNYLCLMGLDNVPLVPHDVEELPERGLRVPHRHRE